MVVLEKWKTALLAMCRIEGKLIKFKRRDELGLFLSCNES